MYEVAVGPDTQHFDTREEAIAAAKALSSETRVPVFISDATGREQLTYQHGELDNYTWETRPRRPRNDDAPAPAKDAAPTAKDDGASSSAE